MIKTEFQLTCQGKVGAKLVDVIKHSSIRYFYWDSIARKVAIAKESPPYEIRLTMLGTNPIFLCFIFSLCELLCFEELSPSFIKTSPFVIILFILPDILCFFPKGLSLKFASNINWRKAKWISFYSTRGFLMITKRIEVNSLIFANY